MLALTKTYSLLSHHSCRIQMLISTLLKLLSKWQHLLPRIRLEYPKIPVILYPQPVRGLISEQSTLTLILRAAMTLCLTPILIQISKCQITITVSHKLQTPCPMPLFLTLPCHSLEISRQARLPWNSDSKASSKALLVSWPSGTRLYRPLWLASPTQTTIPAIPCGQS